MADSTIAEMRLRNQGIAPTHCSDPAQVVRWMGAMQAQDYLQSLWAIASRTNAATQRAVEEAYTMRQIVRCWPVRGTMHVVAAEDAAWMTAIAGERNIRGNARRMRQLNLTHKEIDLAGDLLREQLSGGKILARPDILTLWEGEGIATDGQRGYHMLWTLSQRGLICLGHQIGKQQGYALLDEWVATPRALTGDEALGELVARYLASRGPATQQDFVTWSGLTVEELKRGLAVAKERVEPWSHKGVDYWTGEGATSQNSPQAQVHLMAGFDEYMLGYRDRDAVLEPAHATRVVPGRNGIFKPFILDAGHIVGTWSREVRAKGVTITATPFPGHTLPDAPLNSAMQRYAGFLGKERL